VLKNMKNLGLLAGDVGHSTSQQTLERLENGRAISREKA